MRDDKILEAAFQIMERRAKYAKTFNNPDVVIPYLQTALGNEDRECFMVCFLTSQHQLIQSEILFTGTIDRASVYPREVVRKA